MATGSRGCGALASHMTRLSGICHPPEGKKCSSSSIQNTYTTCDLRDALLNWWRDHSAAVSKCLVCVDNAIDWDLLVDLLGEVPSGWRGILVGHLTDPGRKEAYFSQYGGRHHAHP